MTDTGRIILGREMMGTWLISVVDIIYLSFQAELAANLLEAQALLDRPSSTGPQLLSAGLDSLTRLMVHFDHAVDISSAHFAVSGGVGRRR